MYNDTNNPNYSLRTVFDDSVCTAEYRVVRNGAESFPSSHSQSKENILLL